jgi:hypothetical protein
VQCTSSSKHSLSADRERSLAAHRECFCTIFLCCPPACPFGAWLPACLVIYSPACLPACLPACHPACTPSGTSWRQGLTSWPRQCSRHPLCAWHTTCLRRAWRTPCSRMQTRQLWSCSRRIGTPSLGCLLATQQSQRVKRCVLARGLRSGLCNMPTFCTLQAPLLCSAMHSASRHHSMIHRCRMAAMRGGVGEVWDVCAVRWQQLSQCTALCHPQ